MKIEVYSRDNCAYCVKAKNLLVNKELEYQEIDAGSNRDALIERVTQATGMPPRTVPQIFIDDQYVGGYDDLVTWFG